MRLIERIDFLRRKERAIRDNGAYYQDVFKEGKAGVDAVLADLAVNTGYFKVLPDGASEAELREHNAKRAVFQRIVNMTALKPERLKGIQEGITQLESLSNTMEFGKTGS